MIPVRIALAMAMAMGASAAPPFTLEQILSAPFPSDLTRSPRADAIAWAVNAGGVRGIWAAQAPSYQPKELTHFTADDGQELSEIAWKPDSSGVYFTRGGDPNGRGEFPNPTNNPSGARQEIWYATAGGDARKISDGSGAAVSFDGARVAWVQNGQIQAADADGKAAESIHARGSAETLTWSPVGHKLAFRSVRADHSFIGIYNADTKSLQFIDASVDRDQHPSWSPDGKRIAYVRLPASRYAFMHGAKRTGQPWSIRVTDLDTGPSAEVFRAAEGMGSVFQEVNAGHQILWGASGRLVFPWERDGWLHLYSLAVDRGALLPLTPGSYEVEHVSLAPDGASVTYSSNENDAERRHLWRVPVTGGTRTALSGGAGIEWNPVELQDGALAMLHSSAQLPARVAIQPAGAVHELMQMPSNFPSASLVTPQPVTFPAADGMPIHAQLFLPASPRNQRHPAVVFFHGGSRRQMLLGWHYMFYYHQTYAFNQYLASQGYVVLSVNYRSGTGYGEEFREALNYGPTGGSEFNDVLGAGRYLKTRSDVESGRIGLWGGSYGGYLTALGLARASDLFAVGVDLHGVHDWNLEINNFVPPYEPERRLAVARTAFESSPMAYLDQWKSPVLLIQGDDDRNVPFAESVQLAEGLRNHHVPFEQLIFPDEVHDFLLHAHWLTAYTAASEFLSRHLAPPEHPASAQ